MKEFNKIIASAKRLIVAELPSTDELLDSKKFIGDCLSGLEARLESKVKFDKTDKDYNFVRFVCKTNPEAYVSSQEFKGLIELEKYLATKYWSGKGKHLSLTLWPVSKSTYDIEISVLID